MGDAVDAAMAAEAADGSATPSTSPAKADIFSPAKDQPTISEGSLVIIYLSRDSMLPVTVTRGELTHTKYGSYRHADLIGKPFGCKVSASNGHGFCHILRPTPELWSLSLPHRTQILYMPDIAYISSYLDIKPGSRIVEAGTGSGSFSHAIARTIGASGKLFSFEFHEARFEQAKVEFADHGLDDIIEARHRNVCKDGFAPAEDIDSVFLDVPAPWEAIEFAKEVLAKDHMTRICCFSPCIEQVTKTVTALQASGFSNIIMFETLVRQHDLQIYTMPSVTDAIDKLKHIEQRKRIRRDHQKQFSAEERAKEQTNGLKRKAEDENADQDEQSLEKKAKIDEAPVTEEGDANMQAEAEQPTAASAIASGTNGGEPATATAAAKSASGQGFKRPKIVYPEVEKTWEQEKKLFNAKPAPQPRGHTSYLTFACLMPAIDGERPPPPAVDVSKAQEVSTTTVQGAINGDTTT